MTTTPVTCAICGAPATRTAALALALVHNRPVCDQDWCLTVSLSALQQIADPTLRLGGGPALTL